MLTKIHFTYDITRPQWVKVWCTRPISHVLYELWGSFNKILRIKSMFFNKVYIRTMTLNRHKVIGTFIKSIYFLLWTNIAWRILVRNSIKIIERVADCTFLMWPNSHLIWAGSSVDLIPEYIILDDIQSISPIIFTLVSGSDQWKLNGVTSLCPVYIHVFKSLYFS